MIYYSIGWLKKKSIFISNSGIYFVWLNCFNIINILIIGSEFNYLLFESIWYIVSFKYINFSLIYVWFFFSFSCSKILMTKMISIQLLLINREKVISESKIYIFFATKVNHLKQSINHWKTSWWKSSIDFREKHKNNIKMKWPTCLCK